MFRPHIGHGIGTALHQPPDVLNYIAKGRHAKIKSGSLCVLRAYVDCG